MSAPSELCIVLALFNPCGYVRMLRNFVFCVRALSVACPDVPIRVATPVYMDDAWACIEEKGHATRVRTSDAVIQAACDACPNVQLVRVHTRSITFCKESLQNVAWSSAPSTCTKFLFMDADVLPLHTTPPGAQKLTKDQIGALGGGLASLARDLFDSERRVTTRDGVQLHIDAVHVFVADTFGVHARAEAWLTPRIQEWVARIACQLDTHVIVQPFSYMTSVEAADGSQTRLTKSESFTRHVKGCDRRTTGRAGFAWALHRSLLEAAGGLFCADVVGSSDMIMGLACSKKTLTGTVGYMRYYADDKLRAMSEVIGDRHTYTPTVLAHLYHGQAGKRGYMSRHKYIKACGYRVDIDIEVPRLDTYVWNADAHADATRDSEITCTRGGSVEFVGPRVHTLNMCVYNYLLGRAEDDVE